MESSGMIRRVALVRTDVSEQRSASIIRVIRFGELSSSKTYVLTRATWHKIPGGAILHSYRRENLKSYILRKNFIFVFFSFKAI
jgi:hypothetical protein